MQRAIIASAMGVGKWRAMLGARENGARDGFDIEHEMAYNGRAECKAEPREL